MQQHKPLSPESDYIELVFNLGSNEAYVQDLLIQQLADLGFESFEESPMGFNAYAQQVQYNEAAVEELLSTFLPALPSKASYLVYSIPSVNWNEEWEKNFKPVELGRELYIRASFHAPRPEFALELVIDPKMAFGTGHHETTFMMASYMLQSTLRGRRVLDMGCGSGILSILAEKLGADSILAIDIDPTAVMSSEENLKFNNCEHIRVILGDIEAVDKAVVKPFDLILANINRNVLLQQIPVYFTLLSKGGLLLMSGFYEEADLHMIREKAEENSFTYMSHEVRNNWAVVEFSKV